MFLFAEGAQAETKIKTNSRWHKLRWRRLNNHCLCRYRYRCCHQECSVLCVCFLCLSLSISRLPIRFSRFVDFFFVVVCRCVVMWLLFFLFRGWDCFSSFCCMLLLSCWFFFSLSWASPMYGYLFFVFFMRQCDIGRVPQSKCIYWADVFVLARFPFPFLFTLILCVTSVWVCFFFFVWQYLNLNERMLNSIIRATNKRKKAIPIWLSLPFLHFPFFLLFVRRSLANLPLNILFARRWRDVMRHKLNRT